MITCNLSGSRKLFNLSGSPFVWVPSFLLFSNLKTRQLPIISPCSNYFTNTRPQTMVPNTSRGFRARRRQDLLRALRRNPNQRKSLIRVLKRNPNQKKRRRLVDLAKASQRNRTRLTRPPSSTSTVAPSTYLVGGGDLNRDLSSPQIRLFEEFCPGCLFGSNEIGAHLQRCLWTPEVESRREELRGMLDGLDDDDRQRIKDWIGAHRGSCPWTPEDEDGLRGCTAKI
jgi:hypothetical protein